MTLRMFLVSLLAFLTVSSATAASGSDASLKPSAAPFVESAITNARLAGQGSFRWFGLLIYDAQFWVGSKGYQVAAPDSATFALDLHYARSFDADSIAETSIKEMKKTGEASDELYQRWLQQMKGLFKNVVKGSHVTGIFMPHYGARFFLDGKALGEIADPQFAHAFFAIWLSPKTSASGLREKLLANIAPITSTTPIPFKSPLERQ